MDGPLEWFGAGGTIVAAALIAADVNRKVTGWAFVLFVAVSVAWVISGIANQIWSVVVQNALLLAVNGWGVWRYLFSPAGKRQVDRQGTAPSQPRD